MGGGGGLGICIRGRTTLVGRWGKLELGILVAQGCIVVGMIPVNGDSGGRSIAIPFRKIVLETTFGRGLASLGYDSLFLENVGKRGEGEFLLLLVGVSFFGTIVSLLGGLRLRLGG